jgi:hypothetical protein
MPHPRQIRDHTRWASHHFDRSACSLLRSNLADAFESIQHHEPVLREPTQNHVRSKPIQSHGLDSNARQAQLCGIVLMALSGWPVQHNSAEAARFSCGSIVQRPRESDTHTALNRFEDCFWPG